MPELPDALCRCGNHGCLEAIASTGAIASRLGLSEDHLLASVVRGEANTVSEVREVVHSSLGDEACLIGGMVPAIEQVLSPRGIADHTRPQDSPMLQLGLCLAR